MPLGRHLPRNGSRPVALLSSKPNPARFQVLGDCSHFVQTNFCIPRFFLLVPGLAPTHGRARLVAQLLCTYLATLTVLAFALSKPSQGQSDQLLERQMGSIVGTVTDANAETLVGARVVLEGPDPSNRHTVVTNDNGFFQFHDVRPGIPYHVTVGAEGFKEWTSPVVIIEPNQYKILTDIKLRLAMVHTTVDVTPTAEEIATEQVKTEEKQRIFGIFPNFYVVYDSHPVALTTKLKFRLALKVTIDPVTLIGNGVVAGAQQAGDTPDFGQGALGFAKRYGANTADGLTDIMIGGAILPSLLHQDPRYFYQGKGSSKSRIRHALMNPFVCKGDNGKWQPNYSSVGGDLASSAISNAYYPKSNRGVGLAFKNLGLGTAERMAASVAQEFLLHKWTRKPSPSK
jgi:Carboxypeptidase regulatory-like domain